MSALSEFAALQNGHVVLVGADGSPVRQVTYPPAGTRDRAPAFAAGRLLWVRQFAECDQSLLQLADGKATTLVSHAAGIRTPRLSTDGRVAAWVEGECGDGDAVVHVGNRTVPGSGFDSLVDVSDDGALLLRGDGPDGLGDVRYLPPGATDRDQAVALVTAVGCTATSAGTFDAGIAAWETCKDGQSRLVRHAVDGSRLEQGRLVAATDVQSAAAGREGQVLGVGTRSGGTAVALFADGKLTYVSTCAAGATDCLSSPDW